MEAAAAVAAAAQVEAAAGARVDSGGGSAGGSGGGSGTCTADADYGTVTPTSQEANTDGSGDYQYSGTLNTDIDYVDLELYAGEGAFSGNPTTGTYTIAGDDAQYSTCGLCLLILTDATDTDPTTGDFTDTYLATSGTVKITKLTSTKLQGTITNAVFTHVTIDSTSYVSTPVGDGCGSAIDSMTFSSTISEDSRARVEPRAQVEAGPPAPARLQARGPDAEPRAARADAAPPPPENLECSVASGAAQLSGQRCLSAFSR